MAVVNAIGASGKYLYSLLQEITQTDFRLLPP